MVREIILLIGVIAICSATSPVKTVKTEKYNIGTILLHIVEKVDALDKKVQEMSKSQQEISKKQQEMSKSQQEISKSQQEISKSQQEISKSQQATQTQTQKLGDMLKEIQDLQECIQRPFIYYPEGTKDHVTSRCWEDDTLRFIGYGNDDNFSDNYEENVASLQDCITKCSNKRKQESKSWNAVHFHYDNTRCFCHKDGKGFAYSSGELLFRFEG